MKLHRIALTNFKSINRGEASDLGPINVIFGPTNSGKTSFLEAIFFQFHHQNLTDPARYFEFLHSKADPARSTLIVETEWLLEEHVPPLALGVGDRLTAVTRIEFGNGEPSSSDELFINGKSEANVERQRAAYLFLRNSVKFSSSRRPGDTKSVYYAGPEEAADQRRQRFLLSLRELAIQGDHYQAFLAELQKMFPHLVYSPSTEEDILDFFGSGFLGTAKLFVYLFDERYSLVLIDEPEIHFYPSLARRFVAALHHVAATQHKQVIIATHSPLFLHEQRLGIFYHVAKSTHFQTRIRRVEQQQLLQGLEELNAPAEAILQSDIVVYVEGPSDIGVLDEFIRKFPELDHVNIVVFHLGGGSMGNIEVDPVKLKLHNPLSFVLIDSERASKNGAPDPAHATFLQRCHEGKVYCKMLDRRAIENYFTASALAATGHAVPQGFHGDPYKTLPEQGIRWYEKTMAREIARAMQRVEIEAAPDLKHFFGDIIAVSKQVQ